MIMNVLMVTIIALTKKMEESVSISMEVLPVPVNLGMKGMETIIKIHKINPVRPGFNV